MATVSSIFVAFDPLVHFSVNTGTHIVDISISKNLTVDEAIYPIVKKVRDVLTERGGGLGTLEDPDVAFLLTDIYKDSLKSDKLLEEVINDGDQVLLVPKTYNEQFPTIIDDISQAMAGALAEKYPVWTEKSAINFAHKLLPLFMIALATASLLLGYGKVPCGAAIITVALLSVGIGFFTNYHSLLGVGFALLVIGILGVLPPPITKEYVDVTIIVCLVLSFTLWIFSQGKTYVPPTVFIISVTLASAMMLYHLKVCRNIPMVCAWIVAIMIWLLIYATKISTQIAKVDRVRIPALGEYMGAEEFSGAYEGAGFAIKAAERQKQGATNTHNSLVSLHHGVELVFLACAAAIGLSAPVEFTTAYYSIVWVVIGSALILAYRATGQASVVIHRDILICALLVPVVFLTASFARWRHLHAVGYSTLTPMIFLISVATYLVVVLITIGVLLRSGRKKPTAKVRQMLEFFERAVFASTAAVIALGVFQVYNKLRNRG